MAIAFVAADGAATTASNPTTYSPTGGLSVGHRVLVGIRVSGATVTSVTDNGGNTYTQLVTLTNTVGGFNNYVFEAIITTAAAVITTNYSGVPSASPRAHVWRATGVSSTAAQIVSAYIASSTTATDAITSGTLTPAAQPGVLVGWCSLAFGSNTATAGTTGFTDRGEIGGGSHERFEDKPISALTAVAATFTGSAAGSASVFGVYLQESAAAVQNNSVMYIG